MADSGTFQKIENLSGGRQYVKPKTAIQPIQPEAFEYLTKKRGLHPETLEAYRVGSSSSGEIVIPFFDERDELVLIKFRHATGGMVKRRRRNEDGSYDEYEAKTVIEPKGKPVLLGSHLCEPNEEALTICFGDYDAMACAQDGIPNCVSLPFGDKGFDFIDLQWNFLEQFGEIILFPDNDKYPTPEAELKAQRKLDELATRLGKHRCRLVKREDYHGAKDANDLLLKKGKGFLRDAVKNADWFPSGIVAVADFVEAEAQEGTPTGLTDIDKATGGFAGGQLIVFSGDNGAGKTTEVLNIAANFINEGIPVFLWSGEQKVGKIRYWFERIVAGRLNLKRVTGSKTGFEYFFPIEEVIEDIRNWYRHFLFQYTEVGIEPEKFFAAAELGVRRYGCGLIVIDNLMAFTGGEGESYYQSQGDFAESCKRFAEKWNVPVILICHNKKEDERGNKPKLPDKNSIEGSKKITNWADFVFQLYRVSELYRNEFMGADTILRLCKSRESGIIEDIRLKFDSESSRFCQMSENGMNDRIFGWEIKS